LDPQKDTPHTPCHLDSRIPGLPSFCICQAPLPLTGSFSLNISPLFLSFFIVLAESPLHSASSFISFLKTFNSPCSHLSRSPALFPPSPPRDWQFVCPTFRPMILPCVNPAAPGHTPPSKPPPPFFFFPASLGSALAPQALMPRCIQ